MKAQTYSIVVGNQACNAHCPYCVSKMTPELGVKGKVEVNWRNFEIGARYAKELGVSTAMLTGKGEPTLFPDQITDYLKHLNGLGTQRFPFVELQTNGLLLAERSLDNHLDEWYQLGMTLIAVSIAHYAPEKNRQIYVPNKEEYINLEGLIDKLHEKKFAVRLTCILLKDYIDNPAEIDNLADFARQNNVEQMTVRPVRKPKESRKQNVSEWVKEHGINDESMIKIRDYLEKNASKLMRLAHGATVYDLNGQNLCLSDALTIEPASDYIRQLIFFPDGHLRYDWQYAGAVLL